MSIIAYACLPPYSPTVVDQDNFAERVDRLYVDHCQLADPRPELQRLLADCHITAPEAVIIRQLGELGASPTTVFQTIQTLESQGIRVIAQDQSYKSASLPAAQLAPHNLLQLAEMVQAQHRSQQLQAGHARNRVNLLPPPGRAPYGYRRGRYRYALDRSTAPAVKEFFEHFILYGSIRGAARFLEKTYGKKVAPSTAQRWLQHPVYRGDSEYKDGSVIRDTHTPIISREEAAQVDRLLRRNRKLPPKTVSAERSLAGLVHCTECQSKLRVSRVTRPHQSQEYLYLRPIRCGREKPCRAIAYETVLSQTIDHICTEFPQAVKNLEAPPVTGIKAALSEQVETKVALQEQVKQLQQQGILDATSANLRLYALKSEQATLEQQLSQLPPENLLMIAQTLGNYEFWQDLSESERRVYLREFIRTIWLDRAQTDWHVRIQFVF
ncbi:MAG: recombinase family protein [Cyanobacteria bacterium P01_H01_bin.153]